MVLYKKHDTVTAYIFSQDFSKILLVNKRFSKAHMPPGGHVKKGETFIDAMFREIYEETRVKASDLVKIHYDKILFNDSSNYFVSEPVQDEEFVVTEKVSNNHYHIDHIYCFNLLDNISLKQFKSFEVSKIEWVNVKDITREKFYPNVFDTISFFSGRCNNE